MLLPEASQLRHLPALITPSLHHSGTQFPMHLPAPHFYFGKHFSGFCMYIFLTHPITPGASLSVDWNLHPPFRPGICWDVKCYQLTVGAFREVDVASGSQALVEGPEQPHKARQWPWKKWDSEPTDCLAMLKWQDRRLQGGLIQWLLSEPGL